MATDWLAHVGQNRPQRWIWKFAEFFEHEGVSVAWSGIRCGTGLVFDAELPRVDDEAEP
jgi:hypothetical protein